MVMMPCVYMPNLINRVAILQSRYAPNIPIEIGRKYKSAIIMMI